MPHPMSWPTHTGILVQEVPQGAHKSVKHPLMLLQAPSAFQSCQLLVGPSKLMTFFLRSRPPKISFHFETAAMLNVMIVFADLRR